MTFLYNLKNIFELLLEVTFYQRNDRVDYPEGTACITIKCGIVRISFSIRPNYYREFIQLFINGGYTTIYGDCKVDTFRLNKTEEEYIELQKENNAIYAQPEWLKKSLEESKEFEEILQQFLIDSKVNDGLALDEYIKNLQTYKIKYEQNKTRISR